MKLVFTYWQSRETTLLRCSPFWARYPDDLKLVPHRLVTNYRQSESTNNTQKNETDTVRHCLNSNKKKISYTEHWPGTLLNTNAGPLRLSVAQATTLELATAWLLSQLRQTQPQATNFLQEAMFCGFQLKINCLSLCPPAPMQRPGGCYPKDRCRCNFLTSSEPSFVWPLRTDLLMTWKNSNSRKNKKNTWVTTVVTDSPQVGRRLNLALSDTAHSVWLSRLRSTDTQIQNYGITIVWLLVYRYSYAKSRVQHNNQEQKESD